MKTYHFELVQGSPPSSEAEEDQLFEQFDGGAFQIG